MTTTTTSTTTGCTRRAQGKSLRSLVRIWNFGCRTVRGPQLNVVYVFCDLLYVDDAQLVGINDGKINVVYVLCDLLYVDDTQLVGINDGKMTRRLDKQW